MEGSDSRIYRIFLGMHVANDFSESVKNSEDIPYTKAFMHTQKGGDLIVKKMNGIRFLDFLKDHIEKSDAGDLEKELMQNYINCAQRDIAEGRTYQALSDILHLEKNYIRPFIVEKLPSRKPLRS